jgi:hypothetical protein
VFAVYKESESRNNAPPDWEHGDHEKTEDKYLRNPKRRVPALDEVGGRSHWHKHKHKHKQQNQNNLG